MSSVYIYIYIYIYIYLPVLSLSLSLSLSLFFPVFLTSRHIVATKPVLRLSPPFAATRRDILCRDNCSVPPFSCCSHRSLAFRAGGDTRPIDDHAAMMTATLVSRNPTLTLPNLTWPYARGRHGDLASYACRPLFRHSKWAGISTRNKIDI